MNKNEMIEHLVELLQKQEAIAIGMPDDVQNIMIKRNKALCKAINILSEEGYKEISLEEPMLLDLLQQSQKYIDNMYAEAQEIQRASKYVGDPELRRTYAQRADDKLTGARAISKFLYDMGIGGVGK